MIINKNKLRIKLLILLLCFLTKSFGQLAMIHQNDSIYKVNKIQSIKYFINNNFLATILCDKEGRWIKIIHEPEYSGRQRTEYFEYDEKGKLIKQFEKIYDKEIKIVNVEIEYLNNELIKLTQYAPDGNLSIVEHFENKGRKKILEFYNKRKIIQTRTTEYIDDFNQKKNYGWTTARQSLSNARKTKWLETFEYKFKDGLVEQYTVYRNGRKIDVVHHKYNKDRLIEKVIEYNNVTQKYEYERY